MPRLFHRDYAGGRGTLGISHYLLGCFHLRPTNNNQIGGEKVIIAFTFHKADSLGFVPVNFTLKGLSHEK